jgi:glycosyltransferase involved in cell wall biosynthesis
VLKAQIFGEKRVHWGLLWHAIFHRRERYLLVGWANPTIRAILIAFWVLRRPFMFWSDHPDESRSRSPLKAAIRRCFFHAVKARASHVFAVGRHTVRYFEARGFPLEKLINLPIFIDVGARRMDLSERRREVRSRYGILEHELLYTAASRFVHAKGFDLLIRAVAQVDRNLLRRFRLLLIGHGPEEPALRRLIVEHGLEDRVVIEAWMEPEQFEATLASADVFVHPARFDAFGGGTLHAMVAGIPVIGSDGAGTAVERVVHGANGLIFQKDDVAELAECITFFLKRPDAIPDMGEQARKTAEEWPPERGADILFQALSQQQTG